MTVYNFRKMKPCFHLIAVAVTFMGCAANAQMTPKEVPIRIGLCELLIDHVKYDRKLVEVTGDASHGFEDSGFSSPECETRIWMMYGRTTTTRTMSTVNEQNPTRDRPLQIQGIDIPLVKDSKFRHFDALLHTPTPNYGSTVVHATVIARFFAGHENGRGYGHLGCCSLLAIQKVIKIESTLHPELDSSDTPDQPTTYPFRIVDPFDSPRDVLKAQRRAESGKEPYAFDDPVRVATEAVTKSLKVTNPNFIHLHARSSTPYRIVCEGTLDGSDKPLMIVVSRPAWLVPYAADPAKIAWLVIAAYETG